VELPSFQAQQRPRVIGAFHLEELLAIRLELHKELNLVPGTTSTALNHPRKPGSIEDCISMPTVRTLVLAGVTVLTWPIRPEDHIQFGSS
jgi:hypothetical protein